VIDKLNGFDLVHEKSYAQTIEHKLCCCYC